jgi:hypothetical protein
MNLSLLQSLKRHVWLLKGSYTHLDGTVELDTDSKAGIDPTVDDEETARRKFDAWNQRESYRQVRWQWFFGGSIFGGAVVYWWLK